MRMLTRVERIAGGLLGVHAGDSLGATVEFSPWASIRDRYPAGVLDIVGGGPFDWPAGHATDDTDLTRAVLLAYLAPGDDVVRAAADHMVAWMRGDWPDREMGAPPRDIGAATAAGLHRYIQTGDATNAGAGPGRAGQRTGELEEAAPLHRARHSSLQHLEDIGHPQTSCPEWAAHLYPVTHARSRLREVDLRCVLR